MNKHNNVLQLSCSKCSTNGDHKTVRKVGYGRWECSICGGRGNGSTKDYAEYQDCRNCGKRDIAVINSDTERATCPDCKELYLYTSHRWRCKGCGQTNAHFMSYCPNCKDADEKRKWEERFKEEPDTVETYLKADAFIKNVADTLFYIAVFLLIGGLIFIVLQSIIRVMFCLFFVGCNNEYCINTLVQNLGRWACGT